MKLAEIDDIQESRLQTPDLELNRVLGGGIVEGSVVLLGGEPGIGKSTLLLQLALQLGKTRVLYISGEESEKQIKMRAGRIPFDSPELMVASETNLETILAHFKHLGPELLVIDSIQTIQMLEIDSTPGSGGGFGKGGGFGSSGSGVCAAVDSAGEGAAGSGFFYWAYYEGR